MDAVIVEVTRERVGHELYAFNVIYLYPLASPVQIRPGVNLILTPPSELDALVRENLLVDEVEQAELLAGDAFYLTDYVEQAPDQSLAELLDVVRRRYISHGTQFINDARARYADSGRRHST